MARRIADNVIPISTSLDVSFFRAWLDFTAPLHTLTNKERLVMAHYLKEHYDLNKVVTDDAILAQVLADTSIKQKIMDACNLKASNLQVVLHKFKKLNLMIEGRINPKLVPAVTQEVIESGEFRLMVRFSLK
jgi:hypothetical protein